MGYNRLFCESCEYRQVLGGADRYRCLLKDKLIEWHTRSCQYYTQARPRIDANKTEEDEILEAYATQRESDTDSLCEVV